MDANDPEIKKMNKKDLGKNIEENVIKKQSLSRWECFGRKDKKCLIKKGI